MSYLGKKKSTPKGKDFWGPPLWTMIHILAICFEGRNSKVFEDFLWVLTKLLPCDYCRKNLAKKLSDHPPKNYLVNNEKTFLYSYIVHDLANQHISKYNKGKPKISPPFDAVKQSYINAFSTQGSKFWGPPIWTSIHILAVILRQENAEDYKKFLELLKYLLPDEQSRRLLADILHYYPIDPYLRNNSDTFFYSYMIHDLVNKKLNKGPSPPYELIKSFYFSSLGEECNDCKI